MADQVDFPNIYIDGASGGVGSQADPYSDFSDINWTTGGDNSIFDYLAGSPSASPTIYLAKGTTWREQMTTGASGTATYPIVITGYGSGADPKILGSVELTTWSEDTGHWTCSYTGALEVMWFEETDGSVSWGNLKANKAACVAEYDWYSDGSDVWVFAATDPDTRYTAVETSERDYGITGDAIDYITVDGLEIRYALLSGIYHHNSDNWVIQNNTLCYFCKTSKNDENAQIIFTSCSNNVTIKDNVCHDAATQGIWVWSGSGLGSSNDALVEGNEVYNCYHSNIDMICGNNGVLNGGTVRYNLCYQNDDFDTGVVDGALIFMEGQDSDDKAENIDIYYNICLNVIKCGIQLYTWCNNINIYNNVVYGTHSGTTPLGGIRLDGANTTNVVIKNNISMDVTGGQLWIGGSSRVSACDNNLWYHSGGGSNVYVYYNGTSYHYNDFANYKTATGWDNNGKWENPKFVNAANMADTDYKIQITSPCKNTGVNVSLTEDYFGGPVPSGTPDIGAYEIPALSGYICFNQWIKIKEIKYG